MKNKTTDKGFFKRLNDDYKIVISTDETFEEKFSFKLNKLNTFAFLTLYSTILISATICLVFFTQIREMVPGYPSTELLIKVADLTKKTDSLERQIILDNNFSKSILDVLLGKVDSVISKETILKESGSVGTSIKLVSPSYEDSILRQYVEDEDRFNIAKNQLTIENKLFSTPIKGELTQGFNESDKHYALDISADVGTPVRSILDGRVIFSEWSVETGHVIIIDHGDNIISIYKHNSRLSKKQNDYVKGGQVIAYSGDQGSLSSGPHLHFELWKNGIPIDPEPLINFY
mgnify:FL=1|tara:strand:- start:7288 stop:8154 length:867 start_codon:yes stop_codon:yes gene_type:complete